MKKGENFLGAGDKEIGCLRKICMELKILHLEIEIMVGHWKIISEKEWE